MLNMVLGLILIARVFLLSTLFLILKCTLFQLLLIITCSASCEIHGEYLIDIAEVRERIWM